MRAIAYNLRNDLRRLCLPKLIERISKAQPHRLTTSGESLICHLF